MSSVAMIRIASIADVADVADLLERAYGALLPLSYDDDTVRAALPVLAEADYDLLGSDTFRVAEEGGQLIGCGGWTPWAPLTREENGRAHVRQLSTDPRHLRQGIATGLLREALAEAAAEGFEEAQVITGRGSVPFFETLGFRLERPDAIALPDGTRLPVLQMVASLG